MGFRAYKEPRRSTTVPPNGQGFPIDGFTGLDKKCKACRPTVMHA